MSAIMFDHPMLPALIAAMAGVPVLLVGPPGAGKTATINAMARSLKRRFVTLLGTQCSPEDIGGLPVPDNEKGLCRMLPMGWAEALFTPGGLLFLDELCAVAPAVQAAFLTLIQDLRVGDFHLSRDTVVIAATNPAAITPNGQPLSLPTVNRFFHAQWQKDRKAWLSGLRTLKWEDPVFPTLPTNWDQSGCVERWGGLLADFLTASDNLDSVVPEDDSQWAYPTERSWSNAVRCLAAADACGCDMTVGSKMVRSMIEGCVGDNATLQFVTWRAANDLVNPVDLLDGFVAFAHDPARPDRTITVTGAVMATLSGRDFSPDRWDAAAKFLATVGEKASPELALRHTGELQRIASEKGYAPKAAALKPLIELKKRTTIG